MAQELYPLGVKRDGSYYMNILWAEPYGDQSLLLGMQCING